jgi:hypothetical protein
MTNAEYKLIPDVDWARLAAFVDGEGCISVDFRRVNKTPRTRSEKQVQSHCALYICNNDFRLPMWCESVFGGVVHERKPRIIQGQPRVHYTWSPGRKAVLAILTGILPWLIIKREQAEVAIAFVNTIARHGGSGRGHKTPANVLDIREALFKRAHELKKEYVVRRA